MTRRGGIERSRHESESRAKALPRRSAEMRQTALMVLMGALVDAETVCEVTTLLLACAHDAIAATASALYVMDNGEPRLSASRNVSEDLAERLGQSLALDDPSDCTPLWLEYGAHVMARFPELARTPASPLHAMAYIPLTVRGERLAVALFAFDVPRVFERTERDFLIAMGQTGSIALQRAMLGEGAPAARRSAPVPRPSAGPPPLETYEETLRPLADVLLDRWVDCVVLDIEDDTGVLRRASVRHVRGEAGGVVDSLAQRTPLDSRTLMEVYRTGLKRRGAFTRRRGNTREGAFADSVSLPLAGSDRVYGVLTCLREGAPFSNADLSSLDGYGHCFAAIVENLWLCGESLRTEERVHLALEAGTQGVWQWDIASGAVEWSPSLERVHGFAKGEFEGTLEHVIAHCYPEDRDELQAAIARAKDTGVLHDLTYRVVRPDGELRWVQSNGTLIRDAAGAPARMVGVCTDITERKRAEEELVASEKRFRSVFDQAHDAMVVLDDDRRLLDVNPAACSMLGVEKAALIGSRIDAFVDPSTFTTTVQTEWARFLAGELRRGELDLVAGNKSLVHVEYSATRSVSPGRHVAILRDIRHRKRAENTLKFLAEASAALSSSLDYEATLRTIAALAVPKVADWAAIDIVDEHGHLQRVAVCHADPAQTGLEWKLARELFTSPASQEAVWTVIRRQAPRLARNVDVRSMFVGEETATLHRLTGSLGLVSSMCVPLVVRGRGAGAVTLLSAESGRRFDDSDLQVAEELARRASFAMENAISYREAKEASRLKDEFLATVSHELRTPLNAIVGWATLLRGNKGTDRDALHRGLEVIYRNAYAQVRLVDDVLDVSRIISGKLRIQVDPVDLSSVVRAAVEVVAPAAEAKGVYLDTALPDSVQILGDAERLQQVAWNLLSNAVKFTPQGGRVGVRLVEDAAAVELIVSDTGQGIEPNFLPFIFDRFRQADSTPSRRHGGLGLGLAIARHLVELHGGELRAESAGLGHGSSFSVLLPTRTSVEPSPDDDDAPRLSGFPPEVNIPATRLSGMRVLVCDDEADALDVVSAVLRQCGADVRHARDAAEAFAAVRRWRPDVLVSDIGMPGEDGYGLLRRIRALPHGDGGGTPAIALTAYARRDDVQTAMSAGFQMHMPKPVSPFELVEMIENLARRSPG